MHQCINNVLFWSTLLRLKKKVCVVQVTRPSVFLPADPKLFYPKSKQNKIKKEVKTSKKIFISIIFVKKSLK